MLKITTITPLLDRSGNPSGQTLGQALVAIIDTTAVGTVGQVGDLRLLHRLVDRLAAEPEVTVSPEEEPVLRRVVEGAAQLQTYYHRLILDLLWPETA